MDTQRLMIKMEEQLCDELEDACGYIEMALKIRDDDPVAADCYYTIANQELNHYNNIHVMLSDRVNLFSETDAIGIRAIRDFMEEKHVKMASRIRAMIAMYQDHF